MTIRTCSPIRKVSPIIRSDNMMSPVIKMTKLRSPIIREEIWVDLKYDNIKPEMYMISNMGNVINKHTGQSVSPREINTGYNSINLRCTTNIGRNFLHHRLVAISFIENDDPDKNTVNHKDGVKFDNVYTNLEWLTQGENNKHARDTGLNDICGSKQHMSILTEESVHEICRLLEADTPYREILNNIGMDSTNSVNNRNYDLIGNIKRGIAWVHISKDYDFSSTSYNRSTYTNDQIHSMCEYLQDGLTYGEIYQKIFNLPYTGGTRNKSYYEFIRKLKNKKHFHNITKDYNF